MSKFESGDTAKVFMSGKSQAVRIPKKYRFAGDCSEVVIRKVGRHLILSASYSDWEDYFAHSTRPTDDFVEAVLRRKVGEQAAEERKSFD